MTDDLSERLRSYVNDGVARGWPDVQETLNEAADEIERLRAALTLAHSVVAEDWVDAKEILAGALGADDD